MTYHYDANSQLAQVEQGTLSAILTHDTLGRRTQLQRSNGVTTTYNYDPASRLFGITHAKGSTTLEQLTHGFDPADNKTQATQLIQTATALPPAVTAAYNAVNAQIQFNSGTLGYDPNGNLTNDGTTTYVWDARDRLVGISGGVTASFVYDALDRRIQKTLSTQSSALSTVYLYDGADIVTESGASNASYLSTLNIDEPLVRQTPGGNEFYLVNDLGSTLALTNDAGTVTTTYTYSPFGSTSITGPSTNPFQFTGRENDGNGLYYYRARYYSPSHSRFLSEDPLKFDGGDANLYAYVFNNPTNFVDPTGAKIRIPGPIKNCLIGMLKAAGIDLAKRKSAGDPATLAQGCGGDGGDKGLATRGVRPAPGSRTIQGYVDAATKNGNPTVQRNGVDLFRLRSSGHGQAEATATPQNVRHVAPDGKVYPGKGDDRPVTHRDIRELYKAQTGQGTNTLRTKGRR